MFGTSFVQASQETNEPAIAFAARVVGDANRARLIVDFNRDIEHSAYLKSNPDRVVVELPQTLFSLPESANSVPKSVVESIRFEDHVDGQSRIVLQLGEPAKIVSDRVQEVSDSTRHRLIVDLVKSTREEFEKSLRPDKPGKKTADAIANPQVAKRKFTVVIDPGHGGIDGGATGKKGVIEKGITLSFAQHLKSALLEDKSFNVVLTRDRDEFLSLRARVEIARKHKADLFLSIHADSLRQARIRGATVYTLSQEGSDDISRSLAKAQNRADLVAGLELPNEKPDVTDILIDLTRRESEAYSVRFAEKLIKKFKSDIKLIGNPHRSADFFVLKAPEIPSILLELGYLSNKEDEKLMQSVKWQLLAANLAKAAIVDYFKSRDAK